jgi:hypothetical protein
MSHKHISIIEKAFSHPIATNIDWGKLSKALESFGAIITIAHNNRAHIIYKGEELILDLPHHGHELADKSEVMKLRHYLELVELTPQHLQPES